MLAYDVQASVKNSSCPRAVISAAHLITQISACSLKGKEMSEFVNNPLGFLNERELSLTIQNVKGANVR